MNILTIHKAFLGKYGVDKCAEIIGKEPRIVNRWRDGNMPPIVDLQKLIDYDPALAGIEPAVPDEKEPADVAKKAAEAPVPPEPAPCDVPPYEWPAGDKIAILMPTNRSPVVGILKAFAALFERDKMQFIHPGTQMPLLRARNTMAQQFLQSSCPWSLNWDDDIIPPHGDAVYFRAISGNPQFPLAFIAMNPIQRLIAAKRTLIGGVYFARHESGRAQYGGAFTSNLSDEVTHNGPRNMVEQQPWVALGFTLIHRSVYEDIKRTQPELEIRDPARAKHLGYSWRFFNPLSVTGDDSENSEDAAFCARAAIAGHKTYVDHAVMPVHIGQHGFSYHNTKRRVMPAGY